MQYIERTARELLPQHEYEKLEAVSRWFINIRLPAFDWYNQRRVKKVYGAAELRTMIFSWTIGLIDEGEEFEQALSAATKELSSFLRKETLRADAQLNAEEPEFRASPTNTCTKHFDRPTRLTMGQYIDPPTEVSPEHIKLAADILDSMSPHQREIAELLMAGCTMSEADEFMGKNARVASMAMQAVRVKAVRRGIVPENMALKR